MTATSNSTVSVPTIRSWLAHEEAQLADLERRIASLAGEERLIRERVVHLRELLAAYDADFETRTTEHAPVSNNASRESIRDRIRRQVMELLTDEPEPMHILDIWKQFHVRGWEVPGAGNAANITAHLTAVPDFFSPRRGYYRLRRDNDPAQSPTKVMRQKRAKRSTKGTAQ